MSVGDRVRVKAMPLIANRDANGHRLPAQAVRVAWVRPDGTITVTDEERWWYGLWPHWVEPVE